MIAIQSVYGVYLKKDTIENYFSRDDSIYSRESFVYVINVGFRWEGTDKELKGGSFSLLSRAIEEYYSDS